MSKIHETSYIHPTAVIYPNVTIGKNCYVGAFCIVGGAPEYPNRHPSEPHGGVIILDNVILHGHNTIDAATNEEDFTVIHSNCSLFKNAHLGHDTILYENVTLSCGVKVGGYSQIEAYSTIGLNASVHQKSFIPKGSMIGANSFFKNVDNFKSIEYKVWVGVPCKVIGDNWRLKQKLGI
jgi:UDP-N-acetylglucosamine acyltransferase